MKGIWVGLFGLMFFAGCASQRQKPVCAEIEYRLNHTAMSPDQRAWTAEELKQCRAEQEEYAKSDSLTNRFKKSIYELYSDSKKDSTAKDSTKAAENSSKASPKDSTEISGNAPAENPAEAETAPEFSPTNSNESGLDSLPADSTVGTEP